MAKMFIEEENLISVADSIRAKAGTEDKITFPDGFIKTIQAIPSGGDTSAEDAIVDRSIVEYKNDRVTKVGYSAFSNCTLLTTVDLPNVTTVAGSAFGSTSLININMPNLTTIDTYSFYKSKITALSIDNMPNLTTIGGFSFASCTSLATVDLPNVKNVKYSAFNGCSALTTVNLQNATTVEYNAFYGCLRLTTVDLSSVVSIDYGAFGNCTSLNAIILRTNSIVTLTNTNTFANSGIESGIGYIYVPKALLEDYKVATNWSVYAEQFRAIEDYELKIVAQPRDVIASVGDIVTINVIASGDGIAYQWQSYNEASASWVDCSSIPGFNGYVEGANTDTILLTISEDLNGRQYRCIVKDASGNSVTSNVATITIVWGV